MPGAPVPPAERDVVLVRRLGGWLLPLARVRASLRLSAERLSLRTLGETETCAGATRHPACGTHEIWASFRVWPSTFKRLNLKTCMCEPQKSQSCFQKSVCCFVSDIEHPFFKILHSKTLVVGVCLDCGLLYWPFTAELRRQM